MQNHHTWVRIPSAPPGRCESLDGVNLEQLVERDGPQDPARVVHILMQVAGGLAEAHGVGLVHRDVKPVSASAVNVVVGTPLYLSPEAITTPDELEGRSDLYALGAVADFLLTGTPVFSAAMAIEACGHHCWDRHSPCSPPHDPSS